MTKTTPFEFTTATIELSRGGFLGLGHRKRVNVIRSRAQNTEIIQPLSESIKLELARIPSGAFLMGSPQTEKYPSAWERPQHKVSISQFFMGKYPITQAQWRVVAQWNPINQDLAPDPARFKGDNRPIENVSWEDATEFCNRLSQHTAYTYRLPSEAEWEYACRANTTTPFHFGETITTDLANYRGTDSKDPNWKGNYGDGPKGKYRERTTPVGSFELANSFGLYDMHGNVWEWCQDQWHKNYEGAPTDGSAWISSKDSETERVVRGGTWTDNPRDCRSAYRYFSTPDLRGCYLSFRVVIAASPKTR